MSSRRMLSQSSAGSSGNSAYLSSPLSAGSNQPLSPSSGLASRLQGFRAILTNGEEFSKFKHGRKNLRYVWVDNKLQRIHWVQSDRRQEMEEQQRKLLVSGGSSNDLIGQRRTSNSFLGTLYAKVTHSETLSTSNLHQAAEDELNSVLISDIVGICVDPSKTKGDCSLFNERFQVNDACCFEIQCKDRVIDLEASSSVIRDDWAAALSNLILNPAQFAKFSGKSEDEMKSSEFIAGPSLSSDNIESSTSKLSSVLATGTSFKKYNQGHARERYLWMDSQLLKLHWGVLKKNNKKEVKGNIRTVEILRICTDPSKSNSQSPAFQKAFENNPQCCFSIELNIRTIDLEAPTQEIRNQWVGSLNELMTAKTSLARERASSSEIDRKNMKRLVTIGCLFQKYKGRGKKERIVWMDWKLEKLYWGETKSCYNKNTGRFKIEMAKGFMPVTEIDKITDKPKQLSSTSKAFKDRFDTDARECVFSIEGDDRTVDLEATDQDTKRQWMQALNQICFGRPEDFMFSDDVDNTEILGAPEHQRVINRDMHNDDGGDLDLPKLVVSKRKATVDFYDNEPEAKQAVDASSPAADLHEIKNEAREMILSIQESVEADKSFLYRVDGKRIRAVFIEGLNLAQCSKYSFVMGQSVVGQVAEKGNPVILADAYEDPNFDMSFDSATKYKTTSMLAIPIKNSANNSVKAVLCLANKQDFQFKKGYFTNAHVSTVQSKCAELSSTLDW